MPSRTVLITGGAKGIGKKTAEMFARKGFNLVINYRNSQKEAEKFVKSLHSLYKIECVTVQGDISSPEDCENIVKESVKSFQSIDILIHNAGPYVKERKSFDQYSLEEWQYMVNGNLNSVFYLTKLIIPYMRSKKWGRIITVGYDRVDQAPGWVYRSAFAAAKTGVASLTRTISIEEAKNGITANMVCPGDIVGEWKEETIEKAHNHQDEQTPIGRPGTGEDVARTIGFLCSEDSDFITGSIIPVTGGKDVLGKVFHHMDEG
ncbi:3-oxoacyl-[acyl-carrier protein] reductase [Bacillus pakistanensis]|uniref:3-oxoacyl-[acyl-carrier protein] reductase n=1 Tax=Rossellomorea pakistanensis TaxID=992288 RepID=A0ABS2N8M5_9BACI|nr:3-oxoacyl-[acyl-carrier protein] reductase [Bacillus pakistanensis]